MSKIWCMGLWLAWTLHSWAGEPVDTVQRLSGFGQVNVARLLAGEVLTARGALVWRVDLFAAPMLEYTKGMERLAYEVLMVQDIKQETRCMIDDLKGKR